MLPSGYLEVAHVQYYDDVMKTFPGIKSDQDLMSMFEKHAKTKMEYGHHWHNCKKGNPEDIAAMKAIRDPPKKKTKTTKTAESSIVPCEDGAPTRMCFPQAKTWKLQLRKGENMLNVVLEHQ
ncbi:unnamed protein product [Alopecurus aequalis]